MSVETLQHGLLRPTGLKPAKAWFDASDAYGWRAVTLHMGALLAVLAAQPFLLTRLGWISPVASAPFIGALAYKLTILMHECCHRTLFATRWLNDAFGVLCGGFLLSSHDAYCEAHWQHHRHCGTHDDGEDSDYLTLQAASPLQMCAHLMKPLLGLVAARLMVGSVKQLTRGGGEG